MILESILDQLTETLRSRTLVLFGHAIDRVVLQALHHGAHPPRLAGDAERGDGHDDGAAEDRNRDHHQRDRNRRAHPLGGGADLYERECRHSSSSSGRARRPWWDVAQC